MSKGPINRELDYQRVSAALQFLEAHSLAQPSLSHVAHSVGLSPEHFQRVFKRWVGISPKKYLQSLTLVRAQAGLRGGKSLLSAALKSGLSGTARLHDLFVTFQGMTPGEYQALGLGLEISYGICRSPFGYCLLGMTNRGVCWLSFGTGNLSQELTALEATWPRAIFRHDPDSIARMGKNIFPGNGESPREKIPLLVRGTDFQLMVWRALLDIPSGHTTTYGELAERINKPRAIRALGTAVGQNAISFLIPCHRVIRAGGHFGQYRWGAERKTLMLEWEAIQAL
ncbi:MAG: methylated-DNA--[protein]-cysteine S-methyltransferase [Gammaproteobacteria bacterium]